MIYEDTFDQFLHKTGRLREQYFPGTVSGKKWAAAAM